MGFQEWSWTFRIRRVMIAASAACRKAGGPGPADRGRRTGAGGTPVAVPAENRITPGCACLSNTEFTECTEKPLARGLQTHSSRAERGQASGEIEDANSRLNQGCLHPRSHLTCNAGRCILRPALECVTVLGFSIQSFVRTLLPIERSCRNTNSNPIASVSEAPCAPWSLRWQDRVLISTLSPASDFCPGLM